MKLTSKDAVGRLDRDRPPALLVDEQPECTRRRHVDDDLPQ
jgi:hypothetical protein